MTERKEVEKGYNIIFLNNLPSTPFLTLYAIFILNGARYSRNRTYSTGIYNYVNQLRLNQGVRVFLPSCFSFPLSSSRPLKPRCIPLFFLPRENEWRHACYFVICGQDRPVNFATNYVTEIPFGHRTCVFLSSHLRVYLNRLV